MNAKPDKPLKKSDNALSSELLQSLIRTGELVSVSPEFVYLPDQIEEIVRLIRQLDEPFTVSQFKDHAGLSRKYAIPILEWADAQGITVRMGDRRRVRD